MRLFKSALYRLQSGVVLLVSSALTFVVKSLPPTGIWVSA